MYIYIHIIVTYYYCYTHIYIITHTHTHIYDYTIIIREKGVNNLKRSEEEHGKGLRERAWEGLEGEKQRGKGCKYILINI